MEQKQQNSEKLPLSHRLGAFANEKSTVSTFAVGGIALSTGFAIAAVGVVTAPVLGALGVVGGVVGGVYGALATKDMIEDLSLKADLNQREKQTDTLRASSRERHAAREMAQALKPTPDVRKGFGAVAQKRAQTKRSAQTARPTV